MSDDGTMNCSLCGTVLSQEGQFPWRQSDGRMHRWFRCMVAARRQYKRFGMSHAEVRMLESVPRAQRLVIDADGRRVESGAYPWEQQ